MHPHRGAYWRCRCICGNIRDVQAFHLLNGVSASCGCSRGPKLITHGQAKKGQRSKTYIVWGNMVQRCTNENHPQYHRYGGRGIEICDRWLNSFEAFLEDMGERPDGLTLERKDNDAGYNPSNCVWDSWKTQRINKTYDDSVRQRRSVGITKGWKTRRTKAKNCPKGLPVNLCNFRKCDCVK